jgi:XTP/dITP diphosphohydrolase
MDRLLTVMRRLRAPGGCPWDQEQTHESLREYLLEEAAETVDAISNGELEELPGELGDVLLQVAFHSVIAEEAGTFAYSDVENEIVEKLIRRHPHVFGEVQVADSGEVITNWNEIKKLERAGKPEKHPAERVPKSLGALARGQEVSKALKLEKGSLEGVQRALEGTSDDEASVGAVLEAVIAWARSCDVNAEIALRSRIDARVQAAQTHAVQGNV